MSPFEIGTHISLEKTISEGSLKITSTKIQILTQKIVRSDWAPKVLNLSVIYFKERQ